MTTLNSDPIQISFGYQPGAIGRCVEMHAAYYSTTAGFGRAFEAKVATGLAEFAPRLEEPENGLWIAKQTGRIIGTIAIDGEDLGGGLAHLRWFIVADGLRGSGLGRRLLASALAFCDGQGIRETHLWTFKGLDAARRLYEASGFVMSREYEGDQWGRAVTEQHFIRMAPGPLGTV